MNTVVNLQHGPQRGAQYGKTSTPAAHAAQLPGAPDIDVGELAAEHATPSGAPRVERSRGARVTPGATVKSTWALATKPRARRPAWLKDTLVWEASDPYLYFRMARDGRFIVGGEDEASSLAHIDKVVLKQKCEIIAAKLRVLLPEARFDVDYTWAGAFGESATGLPSIGPVPNMDHTWAVMGFGGNGITYSVIASQVVAAEVRGGADPDADLYRS